MGHTEHENLLFGHVQKPNGVALAVQVCSDGIQSFVKLPLNVRELFKYFIGWPHKDLEVSIKQKNKWEKGGRDRERVLVRRKHKVYQKNEHVSQETAVLVWTSNKCHMFSKGDDG